jgi:hypothetical protein
MQETAPLSGDPPAGSTPEPIAEPIAEPAATSPSAQTRVMAGSRRTIASLLLAVGLLAVGGVAAVSAVSPAPSPGASGAPSGGSGAHTGNCPGM